MHVKMFETWMNEEPEDAAHIFITDREGLADNIMACGFRVVLISGRDNYFSGIEEFQKYLSDNRFSGNHEADYVFIPVFSTRKQNDSVDKFMKDEGLASRTGWHLFHEKPYLNRPGAAEEVKKIIDSFVNAYRIPRASFKPAISAEELQRLDLPPINWIVKDLLPEGLAILSGAPKTYKSFMAIDLSLCVSQGRPFLGFRTVKASVLYCDLESTRRRPKSRIDKILDGEKAPDNFHVITQEDNPGTLEDGYLEMLQYQLKAYPDIKLIITDVYQKVRGPSKKGISFYEKDYEDGVKLQSFALEHHICMMVLHHNSKKLFSDDPFNQMSGSTGLAGSADTMIVLTKDKRFDKQATMSVTGREIRPEELVISFDDKAMRWKLEGTLQEVEENKLMQEYEESHVVAAIKKLVKTNNGEWTGSASDLINASKYLKGCTVYEDPRQVGALIGKYEALLSMEGGISFEYDRQGKERKRVYRFWSNGWDLSG